MSVTDVIGNNRLSLLSPPERIVKSRTREYRHYPIVAIHGDDTLDEDGQLGTVAELLGRLPKAHPTLFVALGSADLLARMDYTYSNLTPAAWQFRVSNSERDIVRPDGVKVAARVQLAIHYFGWKNGNYHKMIDPVTMTGKRLDDIWPDKGLGPLGKLLNWGIALRDFCEENGIEVRPTQGAISAQFLTDPRFYPDARRKVPAIINESAREYMPGNYYQLEAETGDTEYTALYLDQTRAHHFHARISPLPDANLLYAHGRFLDLKSICFETVPEHFYGLMCLDLQSPARVPDFSWIKGEGILERQFVFTNELPHLIDMGYRVLGVRACWGSRKRDTGIPRYAAWATLQLDRYDNAAWLKPLLLATYGVLATRPRYGESVFRLAKTGVPARIKTGRYELPGLITVASRKLEPRIANVIHRGMIEAATRSESIGFAQHLTNLGYKVLAIYADAVIIREDEHKPAPTLPDPWRLHKRLTHLQFINQQAFISGEMTKLPGVNRELLKHTYRSHAPKLLNVAEEMEEDENAF